MPGLPLAVRPRKICYHYDDVLFQLNVSDMVSSVRFFFFFVDICIVIAVISLLTLVEMKHRMCQHFQSVTSICSEESH